MTTADDIRAWTAANERAQAAYLTDHHCHCGAITSRASGGHNSGVQCAECRRERKP